MRKTLFSLLLFVLLFNFVSAQEDFQIFSQSEDLTVCSCSNQINILTIQNTGDFVSVYTLEVSGPGAKYVNQLPYSFTLGPGDKNTLSQVFSVPCETQGELPVNIRVATTSGIVKEFTQDLNAKTCNPIKVYVKNISQAIEPCQNANFDLILENIAPYTETYELTALKHSEFSNHFSPITLKPGQKSKIPLEYDFTCDKHGAYDLPFSIFAQNTKVQVVIPFNLTINPDYKYKIKINDPRTQCTEFKEEYNLEITNDFDKANNFTIDLIGPRFIGTNTKFVSLNPGESEIIKLIVDPRKSDDLLGEYNVSIKIQDSLGKTKKEFTVSVDLEDCYAIDLDLKVLNARACGKDKKYDLNIHNVGKAENINVYFDKEYNFLSFEKSSFDLEENEKEHTFVVLDSNKAKPGKYKIGIVATLENNKTSTLKTQYFNLEIVEPESCYDIDVTTFKKYIESNEDRIPLKIKNVGFYNQDVKLELDNENFSLSNESLELNEDQTNIITLFFNNKNLSPDTYNLNIKIIGEENSTYEKEITIIYNPKNTMFKTYLFVLLVFLLLGILFALKIPKKMQPLVKKLAIIKAISIMMLISLLFLLKDKFAFLSVYFSYLVLFLLAGLITILSFYMTKLLIKKTSKIKIKINTKKLKKILLFTFISLALIGFILLIIFVPQYLDYGLLLIILILITLGIVKIVRIRKIKKSLEVVSKKNNTNSKPNKKTKDTKSKTVSMKDKFSNYTNKIKENKSIILKTVLILFLILLFSFVMYKTYDVQNRADELIEDDFLNQKLFLGETKTIKLSNHFIDPDNDTLYFNVSAKKGLVTTKIELSDVLVLKGIATGFDNLTIVASDLKGGSIESPTIQIQVLEQRFNSFERLILNITNTFGTINFVLAFLVLLLVVIVVVRLDKANFKDKHRPTKKNVVVKKVTKKSKKKTSKKKSKK